jgi:hypothetical protein
MRTVGLIRGDRLYHPPASRVGIGIALTGTTVKRLRATPYYFVNVHFLHALHAF